MRRGIRAAIAAALLATGPLLWVGAACAHCGPTGAFAAGMDAAGGSSEHDASAHGASSHDANSAAGHGTQHSGRAGCAHSASACCCMAVQGPVATLAKPLPFALDARLSQPEPSAPPIVDRRDPATYPRPPPSKA